MEKIFSSVNPESGFFVIAVGEFFTSGRDWHRGDRARPLVRQYLLALDSVLECHPELQGCVVGCVDRIGCRKRADYVEDDLLQHPP